MPKSRVPKLVSTPRIAPRSCDPYSDDRTACVSQVVESGLNRAIPETEGLEAKPSICHIRETNGSQWMASRVPSQPLIAGGTCRKPSDDRSLALSWRLRFSQDYAILASSSLDTVINNRSNNSSLKFEHRHRKHQMRPNREMVENVESLGMTSSPHAVKS